MKNIHKLSNKTSMQIARVEIRVFVFPTSKNALSPCDWVGAWVFSKASHHLQRKFTPRNLRNGLNLLPTIFSPVFNELAAAKWEDDFTHQQMLNLEYWDIYFAGRRTRSQSRTLAKHGKLENSIHCKLLLHDLDGVKIIQDNSFKKAPRSWKEQYSHSCIIQSSGGMTWGSSIPFPAWKSWPQAALVLIEWIWTSVGNGTSQSLTLQMWLLMALPT